MGEFARFNGCRSPTLTPTPGATAWDLAAPAGPETTSTQAGGCPAGGAAELWTVSGGPHVPHLCCATGAAAACNECPVEAGSGWPRLTEHMVDWLLAHKRGR